MHGVLGSASIGSTLSSFFDAAGKFFSDLAAVHWGALLLGLLLFALNLTIRSRALFHTMRAAYPAERIQWRRIWGAYVAAVGFNNLVPARGGDVIKLFLCKSSIPRSSFPAVAACFSVESIFDTVIGVFVLLFAFTQGVFPKPPDFAKLNAFDLSWVASNFRLTLFILTVLGIAALVAFAVLSRRVRAFWERIRQGLTILSDRHRYMREVFAVQAVAWVCRASAFWFLLDAFRVGGSIRNVGLVFGVSAVAGAIPLTPGGAGVQQALLVKVFATTATGEIVAAYSVGQQIAITALTAGLGLLALFTIFGIRSFREVARMGRAARAEDGAAGPTEGPRAPRARA